MEIWVEQKNTVSGTFRSFLVFLEIKKNVMHHFKNMNYSSDLLCDMSYMQEKKDSEIKERDSLGISDYSNIYSNIYYSDLL